MRFVRAAKIAGEENLMLVAKNQTQLNTSTQDEVVTVTKFYFITTRPINSNEELKVCYSSQYVKRFKINFLQESLTLLKKRSKNNRKQWNSSEINF